MPDRPNLLYVFADQMRGSALGCLGDEQARTPHLDRLAAQGLAFRHAIANTPVCTPSRGSLLTGRHALACRCIANDLRLPEDERSIADELHDAGDRAAGYRTGYIGKWHLDGISRHMFTPPGPRRHGFDDYWAAYNCNHQYMDCRYYVDDDPELKREARYDADVQTEQAIAFLERYRAEPFCLFLSWGPPHDPYRQVPQEFLDMYPPEEVALRPNAEGANRAAIAGYYAHITALDRNVGRLMAALDRLGLAEDTLVVFSSDHGDMLWSHGRLNKQQPYEESVRVPLIMRWPGRLPAGRVHLPTGEVRDTLISVADYAPTFLGLLGQPVPEAMNGLDLSQVLLGRTRDEPTSVFINEYVSFDQARAYQPWRGVRTKRHTYARWLQGGALLFDNQRDPYQMRNLLAEPGHEALAAELEAELQGWLARLGDDFTTGEEHIRQLGQWEEWLIREEHFYGFRTSNF